MMAGVVKTKMLIALKRKNGEICHQKDLSVNNVGTVVVLVTRIRDAQVKLISICG